MYVERADDELRVELDDLPTARATVMAAGGAARRARRCEGGGGSGQRMPLQRGRAGRGGAWSMYIRASMNVSSEQPAYFKILRAPRRASEEARAHSVQVRRRPVRMQ